MKCLKNTLATSVPCPHFHRPQTHWPSKVQLIHSTSSMISLREVTPPSLQNRTRASLYRGSEVDLAKQTVRTVVVTICTLHPQLHQFTYLQCGPARAPTPEPVYTSTPVLVHSSSHFHPPTAVTLKVNNSANVQQTPTMGHYKRYWGQREKLTHGLAPGMGQSGTRDIHVAAVPVSLLFLLVINGLCA